MIGSGGTMMYDDPIASNPIAPAPGVLTDC
jgi:hypothetical protein